MLAYWCPSLPWFLTLTGLSMTYNQPQNILKLNNCIATSIETHWNWLEIKCPWANLFGSLQHHLVCFQFFGGRGFSYSSRDCSLPVRNYFCKKAPWKQNTEHVRLEKFYIIVQILLRFGQSFPKEKKNKTKQTQHPKPKREKGHSHYQALGPHTGVLGEIRVSTEGHFPGVPLP